MRICRLLLGGVLVAAVCLLFSASVVYADGPVKLEIVPGDEELNLVGKVGAATRFEDGFRLVARGGGLDSVTFDPTDLTDVTDDNNVIPFWKIAVETAKPLSEDVEETFKLVVTGWDKPGTYSGQLRILKPKEPLTQGLSIPITLSAQAVPEVVKVPATATLAPSLVRCGSRLECRLAQWLPGPASRQTTREIRLENSSLVSARLQEFEVTDLKGGTSGYQLTAEDFVFDLSDLDDRTLSSNDSGVLKVTVKANQIPPDEYKGTIRIPVQDQDTRLSLDVDLKVRGGLFVPIFLIVGGWLLAHVIKLYGAAEERALLWRLADDVEDDIRRIEKEDLRKQYESELEAIRRKIRIKDLEEVKKDLNTLTDKVVKALAAQDRGVRIEKVTDDEVRELRQLSFAGVRRIVGWLSGIAPEVETSFVLWIVRPLLYFLLVIWIIYLGIQQKYIGEPTFGANLVADYVGLITWAMSADIVGRTISKIGQAQ